MRGWPAREFEDHFRQGTLNQGILSAKTFAASLIVYFLARINNYTCTYLCLCQHIPKASWNYLS